MHNMKNALESILSKINAATARCPPELKIGEPCLVAVSKTKPKEAILEAYSYGQHSFGENYVQELVDKASDPEILSKCPGIRWHFIGHLQSNKVSKIIGVPNLWVIETVHSTKLANALNQAWRHPDHKLKIMIQVNTSAEDTKSGVDPSSVSALVRHVLDECPKLELVGLMTIGMVEGGEGDFKTMVNCRRQVLDKCTEAGQLQLSMGMSGDFERAIEMGSTSVRVGSAIFGARQYPTQ